MAREGHRPVPLLAHVLQAAFGGLPEPPGCSCSPLPQLFPEFQGHQCRRAFGVMSQQCQPAAHTWSVLSILHRPLPASVCSATRRAGPGLQHASCPPFSVPLSSQLHGLRQGDSQEGSLICDFPGRK